MLKKTITYTDYDGVERTEIFYFNLSRAELFEKEATTPGGYVDLLQSIIDAKDEARLLIEFKRLVAMAYGVKSEDGKHFRKSEQISDDFINSPAYDQLFMEFLTDSTKAAEFVNGIMPKDLRTSIDKLVPPQGNVAQFGSPQA